MFGKLSEICTVRNPFRPGDQKRFTRVVLPSDTAVFQEGEVHPFYSTFALGRDAEWVGRLFVLEMKEEGEEGIGTHLRVNHHNPAFVGETIDFTGTLVSVDKNVVLSRFEARAGGRLIATGETGQKILGPEKLGQIRKRPDEKGKR